MIDTRKFQGRRLYWRVGRVVLLGSYPYGMCHECPVLTGRGWAWPKYRRLAWVSGDGLVRI